MKQNKQLNTPEEEAERDIFELADIASDQQIEGMQRRRAKKLTQENGKAKRTGKI